jgi:hypothetical protein
VPDSNEKFENQFLERIENESSLKKHLKKLQEKRKK